MRPTKMRKVVPSTPCEFTVIVKRQLGSKSEHNPRAKFRSVREAINRLIAEWDTPSNRVLSVKVSIAIEEPQ